MKDIAVAGGVGHDLRLTGAQGGAGVGDHVVGFEAALLQLQQAHTPGDGIAIVFDAEQIAVGGQGVGADEYRPARLKDFIVCPDSGCGSDPERGSVWGWGDGRVDDIEGRAQHANVVVEEVTHS